MKIIDKDHKHSSPIIGYMVVDPVKQCSVQFGGGVLIFGTAEAAEEYVKWAKLPNTLALMASPLIFLIAGMLSGKRFAFDTLAAAAWNKAVKDYEHSDEFKHFSTIGMEPESIPVPPARHFHVLGWIGDERVMDSFVDFIMEEGQRTVASN